MLIIASHYGLITLRLRNKLKNADSENRQASNEMS